MSAVGLLATVVCLQNLLICALVAGLMRLFGDALAKTPPRDRQDAFYYWLGFSWSEIRSLRRDRAKTQSAPQGER